MHATVSQGEIRGARGWLSDFSLCHELAHFIQPAEALAHGPLFAATLLGLVEQFRPPAAAQWLTQGWSMAGMQVSSQAELQDALSHLGTQSERCRSAHIFVAPKVFQSQPLWSA